MIFPEGCIALAARRFLFHRKRNGIYCLQPEPVIRNYFMDRCRRSNRAKKSAVVIVDALRDGSAGAGQPFHTEDSISDVSSDVLLSHFRNRYHGTARLGMKRWSCGSEATAARISPSYIKRNQTTLEPVSHGRRKSCAGSESCGSSIPPARNKISRAHKEEFVWQKKHFIRHWDISVAETMAEAGVIRSFSDHREFGMDPQEMALWTALCWRLTDRQRQRTSYEELSNGMELFPSAQLFRLP